MRNLPVLGSLVGALALAQAHSHAPGSSLPQICQGSLQYGASDELGLEAKWRDGLKFLGNSGPVVVQKRVTTVRSYADVVYGAGGAGKTRLLRLLAADIHHSLEGRLGLLDFDGHPVLLGAVTKSGMRYVDVALWTVVGPGAQPYRVALASGYRRVARRAEMGGGPVWSGERAPPTFTNPRFECHKGEAWLVEQWFVLGQQGVACWRFDEAGNVAPLLVYRNSEDHPGEVLGARTATVTRIVNSAVGPRAKTIRLLEPPDVAKGFPTCDALLKAGDKKTTGVR